MQEFETMFQDEAYRSDDARFQAFAGADAIRDDFTKMFPKLPWFGEGQDLDDLKRRLDLVAKMGGPMDAEDPLITVTNPLDANPKRNPDNKENDFMTVGFTFLGQFIDHDLTFDRLPIADEPPPGAINERTAKFDLDSVYRGGPSANKELYDEKNRAKFKLDFSFPKDLPRKENLEANIGDPRNDENVIISQLHLAFLKFHNRFVNDLHLEHPDWKADRLFSEAQRLVRWHYQYIVVEQFLRVTLDEAVFNDVYKNGPKYFKPPSDKMPREFQVAAYRFGHSQIRPGYKVNTIFGAPIFDAELDQNDGDPNDLRGGRRSFRRFVEWDVFFDFGTLETAIEEGKNIVRPKVKKNKRIDPFLSTPMLKLPVAPGTVKPGEINNLASRNLRRHIQYRLPSGQKVAEAIGATPRTFDELKSLGFHDNTPLWYYILAEAFKRREGKTLGTVGSRIVAETFFTLLLSDKDSYLSVDPKWEPIIPAGRNPHYKLRIKVSFTMTDLLTYAKVA